MCRRNCPSKWCFKYVSQNEGHIRSFLAICLTCRTQVSTSTVVDMMDHYRKYCKVILSRQQADGNGGTNTNVITTQYDGGSEVIQYFYEDAVCRRELEGQRKFQVNNSGYTLVPGFKCKYLPTPNGLERIGECQQCMKKLKKPSSTKLKIHR